MSRRKRGLNLQETEIHTPFAYMPWHKSVLGQNLWKTHLFMHSRMKKKNDSIKNGYRSIGEQHPHTIQK